MSVSVASDARDASSAAATAAAALVQVAGWEQPDRAEVGGAAGAKVRVREELRRKQEEVRAGEMEGVCVVCDGDV